MNKKLVRDSFIVGAALFSMFFGAGNVVFPLYIGLTAGNQWFTGFLCYYAADVGLALLTIYAMLASNCIDSKEGLLHRLGGIPAMLMMSAIILCIGPLLAIPRTGATAFAISFAPLGYSSKGITFAKVLYSVVFFGVSTILAYRESNMVDAIARYLSPIKIGGFILIVIAAVVWPLGEINPSVHDANVAWNSILAGYQTLDVMASLVFGFVIVSALKNKGYTSGSQKVCNADPQAEADPYRPADIFCSGLCGRDHSDPVSPVYSQSGFSGTDGKNAGGIFFRKSHRCIYGNVYRQLRKNAGRRQNRAHAWNLYGKQLSCRTDERKYEGYRGKKCSVCEPDQSCITDLRCVLLYQCI